MTDLERQFEQAVADSKALTERPDNMTLLQLIPTGATIIGKGRVVRAGRRVIFLEGELLAEDGTVLARATSTAIPTPKPQPGESLAR